MAYISPTGGSQDGQRSGPAVEVQGLAVRYGKIAAVRQADFAVGVGERTGLIGANGSGKSTLLKVLAGAHRKYDGSALILGLEARTPKARSRIGWAPERVDGFLDLRAEALVRLAALAHGLSLHDARTKTATILEEFNLAGWSCRRIREMSRGMRQRVILAQALVHEPDVLFLDEPTSNLDMATREILSESILNHLGERRSLLVSSHDWFELARYTNRFLFMQDGIVRPLAKPVLRKGYEVLGFANFGGVASRLRAHGYEIEVKGQLVRVFGAESSEAILRDLGLSPTSSAVMVRPYLEIQTREEAGPS